MKNFTHEELRDIYADIARAVARQLGSLITVYSEIVPCKNRHEYQDGKLIFDNGLRLVIQDPQRYGNKGRFHIIACSLYNINEEYISVYGMETPSGYITAEKTPEKIAGDIVRRFVYGKKAVAWLQESIARQTRDNNSIAKRNNFIADMKSLGFMGNENQRSGYMYHSTNEKVRRLELFGDMGHLSIEIKSLAEMKKVLAALADC